MSDPNDTEAAIVFPEYMLIDPGHVAAVRHARDMFNRDNPEQAPLTSIQYLMHVFGHAVNSYAEQKVRHDKLVSIDERAPVASYGEALAAWQARQG